jgi:hypothetical protein
MVRRPFENSAAVDFGDQVDLALGVERGGTGVLEDFAVDRHRHALLDLAAEAGEPPIELQNHPAEIVSLHLDFGQPAGEPVGGLARADDARCCSHRSRAAIQAASNRGSW